MHAQKATLTAAIAIAILTPTTAQAHLGDYNTQLANATKACAARFEGCRYLSHTSGGELTHQRLFLFARDQTNGGTCYHQYVVNHNNIVTDSFFQGCSS